MSKVDAKLYEFLKETAFETGMYKEGDEAKAYVHIRFDDLKEFVEIVGYGEFDEGGLAVTMFESTICIELNEIFESYDNSILDYEKCFSKEDIEYYREFIR